MGGNVGKVKSRAMLNMARQMKKRKGGRDIVIVCRNMAITCASVLARLVRSPSLKLQW